MTLYAIDDIGDAFEATRAFLFPFALRRWLTLALVVFFIGGAGAGFQGWFNFDVPVNQPPGPIGGVDIEQFIPTILALAALVVVLTLAFVVIGSIMEFVFVASLREEEVAVRQYFGRYWGKGLRLLGFRIGLSLLTAILVAIPVVTT